jgi:hypothetical protein
MLRAPQGYRPECRAAQHRLQLSRPFAPRPVGGMMWGEPWRRLPGDLEKTAAQLRRALWRTLG